MNVLTTLMGFLLLASPAPAAPAAVEPALPTYSVTLTAYNAVPEQTDGDPHITASGAFSNPEVVAARSVNLKQALPFGTIIELDGSNIEDTNSCGFEAVEGRIGYRVIADAMNPRYDDRIDLLFAGSGAKNPANVLGICKGVTIRAVGFVKIGQIPSTQAELALLVANGGPALAIKK